MKSRYLTGFVIILLFLLIGCATPERLDLIYLESSYEKHLKCKKKSENTIFNEDIVGQMGSEYGKEHFKKCIIWKEYERCMKE